MAARRLEPHRLDVAALAAHGERIEGELEPRTMPRWREMQSPPVDASLASVRWEARGEQTRRSGEEPQSWLHLRVSADAWPVCQRCLQPFRTPVEIDRRFRFVATEAEAEALDADSEDDVLAPSAAFDLIGLIEDELVLGWPLVPRHADCGQPAHRAGEERPGAAGSAFAALAAWKGRSAKP
jgi:uncharacterized protein